MEPLLLRALKHQAIARPPVWMMRQAGRYMKEYRELKEKYSFLELCKTPELALEVTMQPIRAFSPDAAILFADILLPGEAMGFKIDFNPGPKVFNPISGRSDLNALRRADVRASMNYVFKAISAIKSELISLSAGKERKALLGFAGAPWTMACYFTEQGPLKMFQGTQVRAAEDPGTMHELLDKFTDVITEYLLAQIEHGADAVQLFDTWAGNLSIEEYERFALPYTQKIFERLKCSGCPTILYVNGCAHLLSRMKSSGADCLSLDWRVDLSEAESVVGDELSIQGNFNPSALYCSASEVQQRTKQMLSSLKRRSGYIANLGHGIHQTTPPENAATFIETVKAGWIG